ncbi:MAG: formyltetrahydrofolate deformylase [Candidatus Omnitrophica bacterium]|nr:formyltetrahydrofolate deformylase [Candidatus Omnitrophota bacterium]
MNTYILLLQCKDQKGIVAKVSGSIFEAGGNIVSLDQYSSNPQGGHFFMRVEFTLKGKAYDKNKLKEGLDAVAGYFKAKAVLYDRDEPLRMGVLVSGPDHCLAELLYLYKRGELAVKIPFIISNFAGHRKPAKQHNIPFYFIPANKNNRREKEILRLVKEKTDFLVLTRYMLVLSSGFIKSYAKDIINIHHGFLPSFKGKNPYQQALEKGVKIIGATSHFVNDRLDAGPIITQEVEQISHKDDLKSLMLKGRNLEKRALSDALRAYIEHRVIRFKDKTVIF